MTVSTAHVVVFVLAVLAGAVFVAVTRDAGPNRYLTLYWRYGPLTTSAILVAVALGAAALYPNVAVELVRYAAPVAVLGVFCAPARARRTARRVTIRSRWPSVARSCDLGHDRDRRSARWPGGSIVARDGARVEWLTRIYHGRLLPDRTGVTYRVEPARGLTLSDIAAQRTALAAALHVRDVELAPNPTRPDRGQLTIRWALPDGWE